MTIIGPSAVWSIQNLCPDPLVLLQPLETPLESPPFICLPTVRVELFISPRCPNLKRVKDRKSCGPSVAELRLLLCSAVISPRVTLKHLLCWPDLRAEWSFSVQQWGSPCEFVWERGWEKVKPHFGWRSLHYLSPYPELTPCPTFQVSPLSLPPNPSHTHTPAVTWRWRPCNVQTLQRLKRNPWVIIFSLVLIIRTYFQG